MPVSVTEYATVDDLLFEEAGATISQAFSKQRYLDNAHVEMNGMIGQVYALPLTLTSGLLTATGIPVTTPPQHELDLLKSICSKLASGRAFLALDASGGGERFHRYGAVLVQEALEMLRAIRDGSVNLSFELLDATTVSQSSRAPRITNYDPSSLVECFESEYFGHT